MVKLYVIEVKGKRIYDLKDWINKMPEMEK